MLYAQFRLGDCIRLRARLGSIPAGTCGQVLLVQRLDECYQVLFDGECKPRVVSGGDLELVRPVSVASLRSSN